MTRYLVSVMDNMWVPYYAAMRGKANPSHPYDMSCIMKVPEPPADARQQPGKKNKKNKHKSHSTKHKNKRPTPPVASTPLAAPTPPTVNAHMGHSMTPCYVPYEEILAYLQLPETEFPRPPNSYTIEYMREMTEEMMNDPNLGCRGRVVAAIGPDGTINKRPSLDDLPDPRFYDFYRDIYQYRPPAPY